MQGNIHTDKSANDQVALQLLRKWHCWGTTAVGVMHMFHRIPGEMMHADSR